MSACPKCGVAIVPGYARCPKCHAVLPKRTQTSVQGGTSLESGRRVPLPAIIAAGVLGLGLIIWLGARGSHDRKPVETKPNTTQVHVEAAPVTTLADGVPATAAPSRPAAPSPDAVAGELERTLQRQRLWSRVTVTGTRVEVRSGSCGDPAIQGPIGEAAPTLKAAGLTSLRCVEQSGSVVFTREL